MPIAHADRLIPALRRAVAATHAADRSDGHLLAAFLAGSDPDAFALLVRRHGPMVLGVCRRVVGDHHTADDAFQATFLVLARRAAAVRPREGVANWLFGVAFRTAMKARAVLARRRSREKQVEAMPEPPVPPADDPWPDLKPVIDQELARLPDRLRLPVVLCDLEGRPQRAVAKHLGVAPATLASRLATARRLLAARLTRRGVALSGGALAGVLSGHASAAVVPPALAAGVTTAADLAAAGAGVTGLVSAHAVSLSEGVMRMMFLTKLKAVATAVVAALALAGVGVGVTPARAGGDNPPPAAKPARPAKPAPRPAAPDDDRQFLRRLSLDLRGTVPTVLEITWFDADPDATKRAKVTDWLLADDEVRAFLAKKLGVPVERVRVLRTGDHLTLSGVIDLALDKPAAGAGPAGGPAAAVEKVARVFRAVDDSVWVDAGRRAVVNEVYRDLAVVQAAAGRYRWATVVRPATTAHGVLLADGPAAAQPLGVAFPTLGVADQNRAGDAEILYFLNVAAGSDDPDGDFLRKAVREARGADPTELELKYFRADNDPKKREKLLDLLLKDSAVAKRLGQDWKTRLLAPPAVAQGAEVQAWYFLHAMRNQSTAPEPTRLDLLMNQLLSETKTDEQVLDGVAAAVVGRLPTAGEKTLTLAAVKAAKDRGEAWRAAAKALAGTDEAKAHAAKAAQERPVPPAKP